VLIGEVADDAELERSLADDGRPTLRAGFARTDALHLTARLGLWGIHDYLRRLSGASCGRSFFHPHVFISAQGRLQRDCVCRPVTQGGVIKDDPRLTIH
jgi:hypothetical protein